ncbi:hypothetical protein ALC56_02849, partial [Trachymyrmex septentrionalis]
IFTKFPRLWRILSFTLQQNIIFPDEQIKNCIFAKFPGLWRILNFIFKFSTSKFIKIDRFHTFPSQANFGPKPAAVL